MFHPVYDFLGYSINEVKFFNNHKDSTYIGISIPNDVYNKDNKQYSQFIRITTDFAEKESEFLFQAVFQINDLEWFNKLEINLRKSIFFGIAFPFVREKVFSITSDSNPGLFIPTLNVRDINFENEIRLIKSSNNEEK